MVFWKFSILCLPSLLRALGSLTHTHTHTHYCTQLYMGFCRVSAFQTPLTCTAKPLPTEPTPSPMFYDFYYCLMFWSGSHNSTCALSSHGMWSSGAWTLESVMLRCEPLKLQMDLLFSSTGSEEIDSVNPSGASVVIRALG